MISGKYSLQIQPFFLAPRKLVPSGEERGEMAVLASCYDPKGFLSFKVIICVRAAFYLVDVYDALNK